MTGYARVSVEVLAGLGWADLVLVGKTDCEQDRLLEFILYLRELWIPESQKRDRVRQPVFQRSITTFGFMYDKSFKGCFPDRSFDLLSFARSKPGHFFEAYEKMKNPGGSIRTDWTRSIDGTYDISCHVNSPPEFLDRVFHVGDGSGVWPIERSRSHILISEPPLDRYNTDTSRVRGVNPKPLKEIASPNIDDLKTIRDFLEKLESKFFSIKEYIPKSLQMNILWVAGNLEAALGDVASYSDSYPAIESCLSSAASYIEELQLLRQEVTSGNLTTEEVGRTRKRMAAIQKSLASWCVYIPRILAERSAGRFGELFGDGSHVYTSIGGLQKTLLLGDLLGKEFLDKIVSALDPPSPKLERQSLATVFDNVNGIRSFPDMGIIRIPLRHRFSLPRVLTGIWHEIAQMVFIRIFPDEENSIEIIDKTVRGSKDGFKLRKHRPDWLQALYIEMTDIFSDTLVCLIGFKRETFYSFCRDLCIDTFDDVLAVELSEAERNDLISLLITRLLIAQVLREQLGSQEEHLRLNVFSDGKQKLKHLSPLLVMVRLARRARYKNTWIGKAISGHIKPGENLTRNKFHKILRESELFKESFGSAIGVLKNRAYMDLLTEFFKPIEGVILSGSIQNSAPETFKGSNQLKKGTVCNLGNSSLNDLYFSVFKADVEAFLKNEVELSSADKATRQAENKNLKKISDQLKRPALARSAVCTYYSKLGKKSKDKSKEAEGESKEAEES